MGDGGEVGIFNIVGSCDYNPSASWQGPYAVAGQELEFRKHQCTLSF